MSYCLILQPFISIYTHNLYLLQQLLWSIRQNSPLKPPFICIFFVFKTDTVRVKNTVAVRWQSGINVRAPKKNPWILAKRWLKRTHLSEDASLTYNNVLDQWLKSTPPLRIPVLISFSACTPSLRISVLIPLSTYTDSGFQRTHLLLEFQSWSPFQRTHYLLEFRSWSPFQHTHFLLEFLSWSPFQLTRLLLEFHYRSPFQRTPLLLDFWSWSPLSGHIL